MSSAFTDIQNLLEVQLNSLALGCPIAWDNTDYTPNPTTLWVSPSLLPSNGQPAGLGPNAQNRHDGIFQLTVYAPARDGRALGLSTADIIATGFKRGTTLATGNTSVRITAVSRNPSVEDGDWFQVPVSLSYIAYADN